MVRIFLSAVTSELKPAREIAARVLRTLGYEAVYQDEFPTGAGDLRAMLREKIDPCAGVLQLVGHRYGAEPPEIDPQFGRVSYTQFEAEYGRRAGKKVWYIFLGDESPVPGVAPEDEERRALQAAYRDRVEKGAQLYHHAANSMELELRVHRLRDELAEFRERVERRGRRILTLSIAGFLLAAAIGWAVWQMRGEQGRQKESIAALDAKMTEREEKLLAALRELPERVSRPAEAGRPMSEDERMAAAYAEMEKKFGLKEGSLAKELPTFAKELLNRADTSALDRANALFVQKHFAEAEKEALAAKDKALAAAGKPVEDAINALQLAGHSARKQIHDGRAREHWERALDHFRAAAALTSKARNAAQWAEAQSLVASTLGELGRVDEALPLHREVLAAKEVALGPEHVSTLLSVNNLAGILFQKGDYAGAEPLYRRALEASERTLGKEHPSTLTQVNNLAMLLGQKNDYAGAEPLYRRALEAGERTSGKEHPSTLITLNNLAALLYEKGDYAGAEPLFRRSLASREQKLGKEHPNTLTSVNNLAMLLEKKKDHAGAEPLYRRALESMERALGREHPSTLTYMDNLADLLKVKGDYAGAEPLYRRVVEGRERTLGKAHSNTCLSAYNFAMFLKRRGRADEAAVFARQAYQGWLKSKGAEHEDTRDAAKLMGDLGAKADP